MKLRDLVLTNFRNHTETRLECSPGINLITGPNGVGKTSMIDGLHVLSMSRSFISSSDQYLVKKGESGFHLKGQFEGEIRSSFKLECTYSRGSGKQFLVNESPLGRLADLIGMVPVVVLSPDDRKLTHEGPAERRAFFDAMISQVYKSYLNDLIEYRKIMKQRNRLLSTFRAPGGISSEQQMNILLEPWDEQLIESGARIIAKRTSVIEEFKIYLNDAYRIMSGVKMEPSIEYRLTGDPVADPKQAEDQFREALLEVRDRELERQITLAGPHRDDFLFYLDNMELRKFGSQGQHRLFAVALKLGELHFFRDKLEDLPVLLLDDVFGELDPAKTEVLVNLLLEHKGQTFITAANPLPFKGLIPFENESNQLINVHAGPELEKMTSL